MIAKLEPLVVTDDAGSVVMNIDDPVDPDDDAMTIEVMGLPAFGTIEGADGPIAFGDEIDTTQLDRLTYHPVEGEIGKAGTFLFVARDGQGGVTAGRLTIEVVRSNKAPLALEFQNVVWPRIPLGIDEPTDPDGDELSITVVGTPDIRQDHGW